MSPLIWLLDFGHGSKVIYFNYKEGGSLQAARNADGLEEPQSN